MARRYRDLVGPEGVQVGVTDSGANDFAAELSRAARVTQAASLEISGNLRAQQGLEEGERDAAAGKPRPRTGFRATTPYGRAYNSAAEATYVSNLQADVAATRERLEREFEDNPEGFKAAFDGFYRGLVENAPATYKPRIDLVSKVHYASGLETAVRGQAAKVAAESRASLADDTDKFIETTLEGLRQYDRDQGDALLTAAVLDYDARLEAMEREKHISPEQRVKIRQAVAKSLEEGLTGQRVNDVRKTLAADIKADTVLATERLNDILASDLPDEEKDAIATAFQQDLHDDYLRKSRLHTESVGQLGVRLQSGEFGPALRGEARRLLRLNAITPDHYESVLRADYANSQAALKAGEAVVTYGQLLETGFDPGNKKHREAVSTYFDDLVAQLPAGSPLWEEQALDVTRRSGIVPDSVDAWTRMGLMESASPERQMHSAIVLDKLRLANDTAWDYNKDPKVTAYAEQLATAHRANIPPTEAVPALRKTVYEQSREEQERWDKQYAKDKVFDNNKQALRLLMDSGETEDRFDPTILGGIPDTPPAMDADFDAAVKLYYPLYRGDYEKARQMAWKHVSKTWGVTTVNGEQEIVRFPPEWNFPADKRETAAKVIRSDIDSTLDQLGFTGDKSRVRLAETPWTAYTQGKRWNLEYIDEDGMPDIVLGADNRPAEYIIPEGSALAAAEAATRRAFIAEGEQKRERRDLAEQGAREAIERAFMETGR